MIKPISPNEIPSVKQQAIPAVVIEAFNHLIALKYDNGYAKVTVDEIVKFIHNSENNKFIYDTQSDLRSLLFQQGYLNIEAIYQNQGWSVFYDKPGYNELYDPFFTFSVA